ncbi:MAG: hypothetical protein G3M78_02370 [Candidatus Nitrohelix vancouverensis]|uniref:FecR protein domain-containing protein n=1 Tax=Candidatus Nitrohelix vancouverensis TaxID=2705534 RepID=A0A7T0C0I2_9BACT|nr:MAG: hypothetical protein G3M78_02370 [Candidatus Nitrohelix vancouverensis]
MKISKPGIHSHVHSAPFYLQSLFLLIATVFVIQPDIASAKQVATLENVQGNVRVYKEGKNRGRKGMEGAALSTNQIVKTEGDDASADIVFGNGDRVRVTPNSEMSLSQLEIGDSSSKIGIQLAAGKIFNVVNKLSSDSSYAVNTHTAIAGVKGTVFSAEVDSDQSVFMVLEGKVEASSASMQGNSVDVAEMHKTIVKKNEAPEEPVEMTPEEIAMFNLLEDISDMIRDSIQESIQDDLRQQLMEQGGDILINP